MNQEQVNQVLTQKTVIHLSNQVANFSALLAQERAKTEMLAEQNTSLQKLVQQLKEEVEKNKKFKHHKNKNKKKHDKNMPDTTQENKVE